ncbi:MAG: AAA family ATPase, partial [Dactylosporangium sp.]|nr:AAA family ATPase [Dactylosporangium sp.]
MSAANLPARDTLIHDSRSLKNHETVNRETARRVLAVVQVWERSEPDTRRYVVEDFIPEGAITSLFGDGGTGKSYFTVYVGSCVATGRDVLGRAVTQGPVLFVDAELDEDEFVRRAYAVARGMGLERPPEGLHYYRLPGSLTDPEVMEDVRTVVAAVEPVLIVLDSVMAAAYGADLERAADTTAMLKQIEAWGTVLAIDHIPKPQPGANLSQYRQYGSVFKHNLSRSSLQVVQADGGGLILRQTKHNFGPKAAPLGIGMDFEAGAVTFTRIEIDDDRLSGIDDHLPAAERVYRALMRHANGATPDTLADELDLSVGTIRNHLTTLRKLGRATTAGDGVWRASFTIHDSRFLSDRDRESTNGTLLPCRSCGQPVTGQPDPNRPGWLRFSCACGLTDFARANDPGL